MQKSHEFKNYYAVIFTTVLNENPRGYESVAKQMETLAKQQPGYLGMDTARNTVGITVSYWKDLDSITNWKNNIEHKKAREKGRMEWYKHYHVRICKVEHEYDFNVISK
ncbi:MAG: antibiotic biosynthesis monooxygenase [Bacteroidales bacterium]|nr:antibiotic biosynthesis monooxygenase [Bacteroidales bacterium]MCF8403359.1 antibiotic biosynthesis monooxygenase [Bacteroidales bacterium]